ncbi:MAG: hypothetical protein AABY22_07780 [Nanoarchaeota archaeon]
MSKCTVCNSDGAYIGFSSIECINPKCKFYKREWEEKVLTDDLQKFSDSFKEVSIGNAKKAYADFKSAYSSIIKSTSLNK